MSNNREEGNPPEDGGAYSKNGTRPNPQAAVRWGAQSERAKLPGASDGECEMSAEWGKSTGPPTAEGLERCRMRNWRHGKYSKEAPAATRLVRALLREGAGLIAKMKAMSPLYIGPPTASDGFPRLAPGCNIAKNRVKAGLSCAIHQRRPTLNSPKRWCGAGFNGSENARLMRDSSVDTAPKITT
jgi:hypothetical protein